MKEKLKHLLLNFHSPGRRYSYYPSLPKWEHSLSKEEILTSMNGGPIDLYIHIPFCENLCTFCGCNIRITKDRTQYSAYIDQLLKEWDFYKSHMKDISLNSIYFGGGTPTSLNADEIDKLLGSILSDTPKEDNFTLTVETDPRLEQREQLETLKKYGLSSVSIGIQDFNEKTLHNVNRDQTFEDVSRTINCARELGVKDIAVDLIYGLPFQTLDSFKETIEKTISLSPTRICNYPLARVPWQKGPQNAYGIYEPLGVEQMFDLYLEADELLQERGYRLLGMGHYSSEDRAHSRNIMGYTTNRTRSLLGIGVSAISNFDGILFQNEKIFEKYLLNNTSVKISHLKNEKEIMLERFFLKLTCEYEFDYDLISTYGTKTDFFNKSLSYLENNELIKKDENIYKVTETGKHFLRTICQTIENFVYN
jgi:oxygen-independent coproporphyrinogen III oxidase